MTQRFLFYFVPAMFFCRKRKDEKNQAFISGDFSIHPLKMILLVSAGFLSLLLGIIGIAVPMLPTTPFLLLSAFFFARSSTRLYNWLIYHRLFGKYIRDYREKRGVSLNVKMGALLMLWATIIYSAFWAVDVVWVRILLILIALGVTSHILCLKTLR